jgi:hypothetical protein
MQSQATSVCGLELCGLQLLVYAALSGAGHGRGADCVCGAIYKHARTRFKCRCVSRRQQTSAYVDRYFVCNVMYTQAHAFQMYVFVVQYTNMRTHFKFLFKFRWACHFSPSR